VPKVREPSKLENHQNFSIGKKRIASVEIFVFVLCKQLTTFKRFVKRNFKNINQKLRGSLSIIESITNSVKH